MSCQLFAGAVAYNCGSLMRCKEWVKTPTGGCCTDTIRAKKRTLEVYSSWHMQIQTCIPDFELFNFYQRVKCDLAENIFNRFRLTKVLAIRWSLRLFCRLRFQALWHESKKLAKLTSNLPLHQIVYINYKQCNAILCCCMWLDLTEEHR